MNLSEIRERIEQGRATNDDAKYLLEAANLIAERGCDDCKAKGMLCWNHNCIDAIMIAEGKAR